MKVWLVRYALTQGIYLISGHKEAVNSRSYFVEDSAPGRVCALHRSAFWFPEDDYEGAKKAAEAMRTRKIAALHKQIKRLEALEFSKPKER